MDHFLAEVFDLYSHTDIYDKVGLTITDGQFHYQELFTHPRVIKGLLNRWVYKFLFKVEPCKQHIKYDYDALDEIYKSIAINSIYKFIKIDIDPRIITSEFEKYMERITSDVHFVKKELYEKLAARINKNEKDMYDPTQTLFQLFKRCIGLTTISDFYENEMINIINKTNGNKNKSIVTGLELDILPLPENVTTYSQADHARRICANDYYLCRTIYQQKVLILGDDAPSANEMSTVIAAYNPKVIFYTDPCRQPFGLSYHTPPNFLAAIPKLAKECVVIGTKGTLALAENACMIPCTPDIIAFDYFASTMVKEFAKQPVNIPSEILKEYFKRVNNLPEQTQTTKNTRNSILVIDNRKNMVNVLALKISLSNLRDKTWHIVFMTLPEHNDYYRTRMPDANISFMTHPIQEKQGPFNIEDYNILMKDPLTWQLLDNLQVETVLTVQDDGIILKPGLENEFFDNDMKCKYDYVGAPWQPSEMLKGTSPEYVGNGGLSMRNVKMMRTIAEAPATCRDKVFNVMQPMPEDVFFATEIKKANQGSARLPSREKAHRFASEMVLDPRSLGIHKPWGYYPISQIKSMYFANDYAKS